MTTVAHPDNGRRFNPAVPATVPTPSPSFASAGTAGFLIRYYQKHLTRFTPKCGRAGPSCSQIGLELGLLAELVAFTHCEDCRGRGA